MMLWILIALSGWLALNIVVAALLILKLTPQKPPFDGGFR